MSAKTIVRDEYPQAVSVKNDNCMNKLKLWSIMCDSKCIGQGKSEFSAWGDAKHYTMRKVRDRIFANI